MINPMRNYFALLLCLASLSGTIQAESSSAPGTANPLATADQTEVARTALRVLALPEIKKVRDIVVLRWKAVLQNDPPQEAWGRFESSIDEYVFNYVLKAANSDPNYPKVAHIYTPAREWDGMKMPGSRWGGDNPDNIYRIIPIDAKARYRLDGLRNGNGPANVSYTLVGNYETSKTLNPGLLNTEIKTTPDGRFSITLDPQPANGRPNHIQTRPGSLYLFIRDSLSDWRQRANALTIHRLDPPDAPPMTDQQIAERAADIMVEGVPLVYWFLKYGHRSTNEMPPFARSGSVGGLVSQRGSNADAVLAEDEALVITMNPEGAAYFSLVAHDYWFLTLDYAHLTSSLNNSQTMANADGTVTYVVSIKDPGVHNWINTAGLHHVMLILRLQGLPDKLASEPSVRSRLVKLAELKSILPKETRWVTPEQREQQRRERYLQYRTRMADR